MTTANSNQDNEPVTGGRFMSMQEVSQTTSLHRATIYRQVAKGEFPAPIKLSARRIGWFSDAIDQWKKSVLNPP